MSKRRSAGEDLEEGYEGAVDIVFLLIIFFLVTSSFTTEVKEKLALPKKSRDNPPEETPPKPPDEPQQVNKLTVVVFEDNEIWFDLTPLPINAEENPASIELYYRVIEQINIMRQEALDEGIEPEESGYPPLVVNVWSDKRAYAGFTLHGIMACLDSKVTPAIRFDKELDKEEIRTEFEKELEMAEQMEEE